MTPETVIMLLAFSLFALCSALFITRATAASSFRNKIAAPRGFTEGAAIGPAYPLWILSYGMLFVQCAAFMAFPTSDELSLNHRIIAFTVNLAIFFLLRSANMPLLAVWFGRTGIWISHGVNGLIKFDSIVACEILGRKKRAVDPNAMCTVVFYTNVKRSIFHSGKLVCKVSACELEPYLSKLPVVDDARSAVEHSLFAATTRLLSAVSIAITLFGAVCFAFSTSVFSPYAYRESEGAEELEFKTYAPITDALDESGLTVVRHKGVEVINVYSEDGVLIWSLSRKKDFFPNKNDGISAAEGVLRYTVNGSNRFFRVTDGVELTAEEAARIDFPSTDALRAMDFEFHPLYIRKQLSDRSYKYTVDRPALYTLFIPSVAWGILLFGAATLYLMNLITAFVNKEQSADVNKEKKPPIEADEPLSE